LQKSQARAALTCPLPLVKPSTPLVVSEASDTVGEGRVELRTNCDVLLSGSGFAAGDIGVACYASDNYTVTKTSTSNSVIGTVVEVLSASPVRIRLSIEA